MPEVLPQNHATILRGVRQLQSDLRAARDSTQMKKGYKGFDHVEAILGNLHEAVNATRDRDQIVSLLEQAKTKIVFTGGGDAAPVAEKVCNALTEMQGLLKTLPA